MLAPHAEGLEGSLLQLGQCSLERVPRWVAQIEADSGLSCGLRSTGIVVPFRSSAERDRYPTAAFGEPLNRDQLIGELPGIAPVWTAGLLFSQDGQIDNRRQLMRALESACVDRGVQFEEGVEVLELLRDGQQLCAIRTSDSEGTITTHPCQKAVLCSGAWSAQLLPELQIAPVKGQMLSLQAPARGPPAGDLPALAPTWCPGRTAWWWWVPPPNRRPASAKGSPPRGRSP